MSKQQDLEKVVAAGAFGLAAFHLQNAILTTLERCDQSAAIQRRCGTNLRCGLRALSLLPRS